MFDKIERMKREDVGEILLPAFITRGVLCARALSMERIFLSMTKAVGVVGVEGISLIRQLLPKHTKWGDKPSCGI